MACRGVFPTIMLIFSMIILVLAAFAIERYGDQLDAGDALVLLYVAGVHALAIALYTDCHARLRRVEVAAQ